jgi:chemotaxis protein CheX
MTVELTASLAPSIAAMVVDVWESFLLEPPELVSTDALGLPNLVTSGSVSLTGAWEGVLFLECPPELAAQLSCAMLGMEDGEATDEDVADTMGEVANVLGGNLKNVLPGPTRITLPVVSHTTSHAVVKDGRQLCRLAFTWAGGPLQVIVWGAA